MTSNIGWGGMGEKRMKNEECGIQNAECTMQNEQRTMDNAEWMLENETAKCGARQRGYSQVA